MQRFSPILLEVTGRSHAGLLRSDPEPQYSVLGTRYSVPGETDICHLLFAISHLPIAISHLRRYQFPHPDPPCAYYNGCARLRGISQGTHASPANRAKGMTIPQIARPDPFCLAPREAAKPAKSIRAAAVFRRGATAPALAFKEQYHRSNSSAHWEHMGYTLRPDPLGQTPSAICQLPILPPVRCRACPVAWLE
jgi:hypothetical protein